MDMWCTGDVRINQFDIGETIAQRRKRAGVFKNNTGPPPERRSTISSAMTNTYQVTRMRNLSGGSDGSTTSGSSSGSSTQMGNQYSSTDNQLYFPLDITPFANSSTSSTSPPHRGDSSSSHRKLDRSLSDSDSDRSGNGSSHRSVNSSRYKTELCRPFEESGSCKYGDKCQFAHGAHELRNLARHPKYKTELCRTFHTIGFCPYGPRCHFIHEDDKTDGSPKSGNSGSTSPSLSPTGSTDNNNFSYCSESTSQMNIENTQINNSLTVNINNFGGNFDVQSLEQRFNSALNLNRQCSESSRNMFNNASSIKSSGDIFDSITVFNADEVVDNAPKPSSSSSVCSYSQQLLDNYPTRVDTGVWSSSMSSQSMAPADPFHSPTGSTGSSSSSGSDSSSSSDCSGSTESLVSSGFSHYNNVDWNRPSPFDLVLAI